MKSLCIRLATLTSVVLLCAGCMMSKNYEAYRGELDDRSFLENYADTWGDWFGDLSDVASIELSAGRGIGVNVQPTKLVQTGVLFEDVMKVGLRNRGFGFYSETRKEGGLSWAYYRDMTYDPIVGTPCLFDRERRMQDFSIRHNSDRHWCDVGAEFHAVCVGASAFVSPKQTLDFVGNTITLPYNLLLRPVVKHMGLHPPEFDLCNDDKAAAVREKTGAKLIEEPEEFEPAETLDELMRLDY